MFDIDKECIGEKRENATTKEEMYMLLALSAASNSKDPSTQVGACYVSADGKETGYHLININKRINGSMNYMGTYGIRSFKIDNSYVYGGMSLYASNGQHNPANNNPLRELSLSPEADGAIDFKVSGNTVFQVKSDIVKHTGTGAFGDVKIMSGIQAAV